MSERRARIDFTNLPPRPRQLKPEDLRNVFGGCNGYLWPCVNNSDCCSGMTCNAVLNGVIYPGCSSPKSTLGW